jgi:hypothetical protein
MLADAGAHGNGRAEGRMGLPATVASLPNTDDGMTPLIAELANRPGNPESQPKQPEARPKRCPQPKHTRPTPW